MPEFAVIGGGLAGAKTVESLRAQGFTGALTLICEEDVLPYERPPLSKDYLAGNAGREDFVVHPDEWYRDNAIELRLGTRANGVHPGSHEIELADGSRIGYDKLALATGSRPRRLRIPGTDARGVHYLRRATDADRIREGFEKASRLVVIGGGWIGLETAAVARNRGIDVTIIETAELPLLAALGPELARTFADLHREHGVDLKLSSQVEEIGVSDGVVHGVRLADGTEIPADIVLIGVGAWPDTQLAESAGLDVDNGVLVGASLSTSDPDIVAAGDIANVLHPVLGSRVRVEHWANALNQPSVAATTMLGSQSAFTELPFFFTDQYDLGMEYLGHVPPGSTYQVVIRGDTVSREFIAFWLNDSGQVRAGMNVNVWDVSDTIKNLILSGAALSADKLADPNIALDPEALAR